MSKMNGFKDKPSGLFSARLFFYGIGEERDVSIETWYEGLEPMTGFDRAVDEWAMEHLSDRDPAELRELFKLPPGSHQVFIRGKMNGWQDSFSGEYEEDFDILHIEHAPIPKDFEEVEFGTDFSEVEGFINEGEAE